MSDVQAWLDQVTARLEAVKNLPIQEDREHETTFEAWSDLYEHAPTDLTKALAALQAVLDRHKQNIYGSCTSCAQNRYPCPTVRAIRDAIGEDQA